MLSHDAVTKCEYEYNHRQIFENRGRRGEGCARGGEDIEGWGFLICADLVRGRISGLLLFEPAREPRVTCVAESGW